MSIQNLKTWTDVNLTFNKTLDGDVVPSEDYKAIYNSLYNIMNTIQGERRMLPEFALPIYKLLFEPMTEETAQQIGENILNGADKWDDRIIIKNIHVNSNHDMNQYEVLISFQLRNREETTKLAFVLKRI